MDVVTLDVKWINGASSWISSKSDPPVEQYVCAMPRKASSRRAARRDPQQCGERTR